MTESARDSRLALLRAEPITDKFAKWMRYASKLSLNNSTKFESSGVLLLKFAGSSQIISLFIK